MYEDLEAQLRNKLDINKDGQLHADDVIAAVRAYEWVRLGIAAVAGLVIGVLFF